jgi:hypothetical protein
VEHDLDLGDLEKLPSGQFIESQSENAILALLSFSAAYSR